MKSVVFRLFIEDFTADGCKRKEALNGTSEQKTLGK